MSNGEAVDVELELITASLLPGESLIASDPAVWPRIIDISSKDSKLALHVSVDEGYPESQAVIIEVKGRDIGREEAEEWKGWVHERMAEWDATSDYPLFQLLTTHMLPLLATSSPSPPPITIPQTQAHDHKPYHALLTSHHLLAPSKRKNLHILSSQLSLTGFSKTGHPGIMYAIGEAGDLNEWLREVKSWQWLALRVRIAVEEVPDRHKESMGRGMEEGARGGKGRGEWVEVEKINEALEWLGKRGREGLLLDLGMGASSK